MTPFKVRKQLNKDNILVLEESLKPANSHAFGGGATLLKALTQLIRPVSTAPTWGSRLLLLSFAKLTTAVGGFVNSSYISPLTSHPKKGGVYDKH